MSYTSPARRYTWVSYDITSTPRFDPDVHHYLCYQREIGNEEKKIHWQGYVELKKPMRYGAMWASLGLNGQGKLLVSRGTWEDNKKYCSKEDTRFPGATPKEFGTPCTQGSRNDLKDAIEVLQTKGMEELKLSHPHMYVRYWKGFEKLISELQRDELRKDKPFVHWIYGPTGSGKTHFAEQYANEHKFSYYIYNKSLNGFWQKYNQQPVLILDDFRADTFKFDELLRILDRYQYVINQKQGERWINSPYIFITAPVPPEEMFPNGEQNKEWDQSQLLRRIDVISHCEPRNVPLPKPLRMKIKGGKLVVS